ncbi:L-histidine N(alpha)-methyltransferase [Pedobacter duraquae]|uniref:Dimethylhistidine N-methyltransferase n=1 Tax=Pedobacter duraquae TaxID=425511 RepID=A0A4R6IP80_9SPHI|nr:L-histidine N(alpha)-methyltransferase [Pedobacter duraquae]TDO24089.1 dimethylhistidine N-methyltransferase [Pedobacter duraquae]
MARQFLADVISDLSRFPKKLSSKYFYDEAGDKLFQQIMNCDEYYPTDCELEIFTSRTDELVAAFTNSTAPFDLIELGAGDATKSSFLLSALVAKGVDFKYIPIDISGTMINYLETSLPNRIPGLTVNGLKGDYFDMLDQAYMRSERRKVLLFLGGNLGNMPVADALGFCQRLHESMKPGDLLLLGFDLKKNPQIILAAYNDIGGLTRDFNLNLLKRVNRELDGNFVIENFQHYPSYDPETGACKSYLISLTDQEVVIAGNTFSFAKDEFIDMEISQKYSIAETDNMATDSGFVPVKHLLDSKGWFLDTIWEVSQ